MPTKIIMPNLSQTTEEVHLIDWYVKEGDKIKKGDFLCEVETDKVTTEVESFAEGTVLEILIEPDTMVKAGTVIAIIGDPGEKIEEGEEGKAKDIDEEGKIEGRFREDILRKAISGPIKQEPEKIDAGAPVKEGEKKKGKLKSAKRSGTKATSIVKNLADKKNIDLAKIKGTGPGGLITIKDLENYEVLNRTGKSVAKKSSVLMVQKIELSSRQLEIAKNLTESKRDIPHYTVTVKIWVDRLLNLREEIQKGSSERVSHDSIFIYAIARALKGHPRINGYFNENKLILRDSINIGLAVSYKGELYVPVVKGADKKDIEEIDNEITVLVGNIKSDKMGLQDFTDGGITISNLGMYSVENFTAIIPPKQSCILAIGKIQKALFIDESNNMRIRDCCFVTGSFDHRIINGAEAAEFLSHVKKIIEEEL